jgi:glycosyltransferase involved in cell wall biosynthesis/tetratricopeptide (TPR) repeat protein
VSLPTLSLIIPVRNGGRDFQRCLAAVAASTIRPYEFFVVDDGSTDATPQWAAEAGATVLHTAIPGGGPALARNLAAAQATGDILYFCDADVEIRPDTLAHIQRVFAQDAEVAALFGSYDDQPGDSGFLSQYKNLFHHYVHQQGSDEASTFWSGCGAIRRDLFLKYGGFSSRYELPSIEDIELGYTLKRNGHSIRLDKTLLVKHLKRWTWPSLLHSDIVARGIPWTRLILREGAFLNDLNLQTHNRISVVVVYLLALCAVLGFWQPLLWLGLPLGAVALLYMNRHVYQFFAEKRGWVFVFGVLFVHWLYYFYNGISFGLGALLHVVEDKSPPGNRISSKRVFALLMSGCLLLATFLRFHALGAQSMWLDELLEIGEAHNDINVIANDVLSFGAMPLDYIVTHAVLPLGDQDFWLRVAPALWSVLSVAVMYRLAGRLLGRGGGALAALLLTVAAFHVRYGQETRPYALFGLLSLLSFYCLFRALKTNRLLPWGGYALATTLCLFTHYFSLFMIAAQVLIAGLWLLRPIVAINVWSRARRFSGAVGVVVLALAFTPTFYNVLDVGRIFVLGVAQPATLSEPADQKPNKEAGPVLDRALFDDQILQVLSGGGMVWRWLFLGFVVLGLGVTVWRWPRFAAMLVVWAVVPTALILLFLIHRGTFFATRYVTPAYFALLLLITIGLLSLGRALAQRWPGWRWLVWAVIVIVPFAFSIERVQAYYQTSKEDWRDTGQFIAANFKAGDKVDAPAGGAVVFHYAENARADRLDISSDAELSQVTGRLWVVMHPYLGSAERGLRNWLASQPSTVEYPIDDTLSVFVVDNAHSRAEVLASIQPPNQALALVTVANQYADLEDTVNAEADYRKALSLSDEPQYRVVYANFLREIGRTDEALAIYTGVVAAYPNQAEALTGLGRIYFERGLFTEAAPVLEKAVALDSQNYAADYYLWQTADRLGQTAEANRYRDLAAQLVPDLIEPP